MEKTKACTLTTNKVFGYFACVQTHCEEEFNFLQVVGGAVVCFKLVFSSCVTVSQRSVSSLLLCSGTSD